MTIFAILLPAPNPALSDAILEAFKDECLSLSDTQWIVSSTGTIQEVTARAGIYNVKHPDNPTIGNAVVFATTSYFGRAPVTTWDWIRSKLEAKQNG